MIARWLPAALVVVALLVAIHGPPTAATLAAFTSEGSARGNVTAGRWSATGTPSPPGHPSPPRPDTFHPTTGTVTSGRP